MNNVLLTDLEHSRKRLAYYSGLKDKKGFEKSKAISKWIVIYSERIQRLEKQVTKLGLKTQLNVEKFRASRTA